jgi:site-specific DNA recombinase
MASPNEVAPAVLYAAKSTADERDSIPTQLEDCRGLAERDSFPVDGEYQDEAASAFKGDRGPGLQAAMDHAERIKGVLIVQHTDRLARGDAINARHLIEIYLWALKASVTLRSVQDDSTCENIVMAAVMGERNTEDSRRKSLAVQAGKRRAWERGDFPGGPTQDGFQVAGQGEDRKVRLDPDRIKVINLIGALVDEGWGEPSIARELNRRGHRTKGGNAWTRRRIQDLLTNPIYYGGIPWRRGTAEEEINWDTSYPAPWTREDFERRARGRRDRDLAKGSDRRPGPPHRNHALAGLALCGRCVINGRNETMRPITSTYRRKDASRKRTYVCRHVHDCTGLCDAPPIDAELIDTQVVNELQRYLGDFEAWRDQLESGYASERQRLERELSVAATAFEEQEQAATRADRLGSVATTDAEAQAALRIAAKAHKELELRRRRLEATQRALDEVPDQAPADAMLDFYNELSAAVRGRLAGANTIGRVNGALRDIFDAFILEPPPHVLGDEGIFVIPVLRKDGYEFDQWLERIGDLGDCIGEDEPTPITPPLRTLQAPSAQLANAHE